MTFWTRYDMNARGILMAMFLLISGTSGTDAAPLELIAGWDFQTTATGGTAAAAAPSTPNQFQANVGTGTFYLNGQQGSSVWTSSSSNTELNAFTGTAINATNGLSSAVTTTSSLALVGGGTGNPANGKSGVFTFSTLGKTDIQVSLAAQRSSTGFATQDWAYSTDGTNYVTFATLAAGSNPGDIRDTFLNTGVLTLPTLPSLMNNLANAWVRVTFSGATGTGTGNNRLDNLQIVGVPEPSTYALATIAAGTLGYLVRLRKQRSQAV